jgi:hypothetical protein
MKGGNHICPSEVSLFRNHCNLWQTEPEEEIAEQDQMSL